MLAVDHPRFLLLVCGPSLDRVVPIGAACRGLCVLADNHVPCLQINFNSLKLQCHSWHFRALKNVCVGECPPHEVAPQPHGRACTKDFSQYFAIKHGKKHADNDRADMLNWTPT